MSRKLFDTSEIEDAVKMLKDDTLKLTLNIPSTDPVKDYITLAINQGINHLKQRLRAIDRDEIRRILSTDQLTEDSLKTLITSLPEKSLKRYCDVVFWIESGTADEMRLSIWDEILLNGFKEFFESLPKKAKDLHFRDLGVKNGDFEKLMIKIFKLL